MNIEEIEDEWWYQQPWRYKNTKLEGIEDEWWYQQPWHYKNTKLEGPFLDIEINNDFYIKYEVLYMPFIYKGNRIILSNEY